MNTQRTEKAPAMQFYVRDHLVDTQCLSLPARGVWMTVLCHLWLQPERGTMTHPLGVWAQLLGTGLAEVRSLLAEIARAGVGVVQLRAGNAADALPVTRDTLPLTEVAWLENADGNACVAVTCRRMHRDALGAVVRRDQTRERVARHRLAKRAQGTMPADSTPAPMAETPAVLASNTAVTPPSSYASATASATAVEDTPLPPEQGAVKRERRRAVVETETPQVLPPSLDVPAFHAAWDRWLHHHRLRRKPLPATTVEAQLAKLAGMGSPELAVAAIEQSIAANWQGLFAPREAAARPSAAQPTLVSLPGLEPSAATSWLALATARCA